MEIGINWINWDYLDFVAETTELMEEVWGMKGYFVVEKWSTKLHDYVEDVSYARH